MAFWQNVWTYLKGRVNKPSSIELLVKSFGALLTIWAVGFFMALMGLVSGIPNWNALLLAGLGATSQFTVVLLRTVFGKQVDNGDGT